MKVRSEVRSASCAFFKDNVVFYASCFFNEKEEFSRDEFSMAKKEGKYWQLDANTAYTHLLCDL